MRRPQRASAAWSTFLDDFHRDRPGITEDVLARCRSDGIDPYQWLAEALPSTEPLLDLACGSAPLRAQYRDRRWVGVDRSPAELDLARRRGGDCLVRADATRLPVRDEAFPAAVCSMAVMVVQPLASVLAELHRVLVPGAIAVLVVPGTFPLTPRDLVRYAQLILALRKSHLDYPNDRELARFLARTVSAGFALVEDRRRRFALPLVDDAGRLFVRSLYLPGTPGARVRAAAALAGTWQGSEIGIPLRRVVLRRLSGAEAPPAVGGCGIARTATGFHVGMTVRATWNGVTVAESERTVVVEGNHYFPPDAADRGYLQESATRTRCPWKGRASYYDVVADGTVNPDAAWYYPKPWPLAAKIRGHVAFWHGVNVEEVPLARR